MTNTILRLTRDAILENLSGTQRERPSASVFSELVGGELIGHTRPGRLSYTFPDRLVVPVKLMDASGIKTSLCVVARSAALAESADIGNYCVVGDETVVMHSAKIGNNVFIGHGVIIQPFAVIADGAWVPNGALIPRGAVVRADGTYSAEI